MSNPAFCGGAAHTFIDLQFNLINSINLINQ